MHLFRSINFWMILTATMILFSYPAAADDPKFENTEKGIIDTLSKPRTRVYSKTRSMPAPGRGKTRQIKVATQKRGVVYVKQITVPDEPDESRVNLKIEYDVDSSIIRPQSYELLNKLGRALLSPQLEHISVVINGHTDSDGDEGYNLKLSLSRAISVKNYLSKYYSIPSSRLKVVGYGEAVPLVPNTTRHNKQINRRVEVAGDEEG